MKKYIILTILMAIALFSWAGCAPMATQRYTSYGKNVTALRDLYAKSPQKIKVGEPAGWGEQSEP